jgi:hypothetical protein
LGTYQPAEFFDAHLPPLAPGMAATDVDAVGVEQKVRMTLGDEERNYSKKKPPYSP